jgi:TPP-dependent pyruvate/acetoin dehydrogenase alpha subunit
VISAAVRLDAIHCEVKEDVQAAMRFAEESPEPDAAALYEDLFAENPEELVRDGSESAD